MRYTIPLAESPKSSSVAISSSISLLRRDGAGSSSAVGAAWKSSVLQSGQELLPSSGESQVERHS